MNTVSRQNSISLHAFVLPSLHIYTYIYCFFSLWLQWSDKAAYEETLLKLGGLFKKNFEVFMNHKIGKDDKLTEEILAAGPVF